jgi:23S rRNA pseudouridine1911/1915/1917 synthase
MVVDKPSGLLVIATPKNEKNTLTYLLNLDMDSRGEEVNLYPCHRLDRETSGLIIYAKGKKSQQLMMEEFKRRAVKKIYIAFIQGIVKENSGVINSRIYNRNKRRDEPAVTKYNVTKRLSNFSILEVEPVTGRTNQIRIHLKRIGHPIIGESVYAFRKDFKLRFHRTALHAQSLEFMHPITKEMKSFTSPMPKDMTEFLQRYS